MYWLTILSTLILLLFAYFYFQSSRKLKIRKSKLDWEGKTHKLVDISENLADQCAVL